MVVVLVHSSYWVTCISLASTQVGGYNSRRDCWGLLWQQTLFLLVWPLECPTTDSLAKAFLDRSMRYAQILLSTMEQDGQIPVCDMLCRSHTHPSLFGEERRLDLREWRKSSLGALVHVSTPFSIVTSTGCRGSELSACKHHCAGTCSAVLEQCLSSLSGPDSVIAGKDSITWDSCESWVDNRFNLTHIGLKKFVV